MEGNWYDKNLFPHISSVKMNKHAKYLGQRSLNSKVRLIDRNFGDKHARQIAQPEPLKWLVMRPRSIVTSRRPAAAERPRGALYFSNYR